MKDKVEYRHFPIELRLAGDEAAPSLEGHAAVFNQLSEDFGGWRERIAPGAFTDAIKGDVRALWNHENDLVLGRTKSGTLVLEEDETGLRFRVTLPNTSWVKDRLVSLKRGDVTGASFGFWTEKDEWQTDGEQKVRTILKVRELLEVSPGVTFPAYPQSNTEVARRSLEVYEAARTLANGQAAANLVQMDLRNRRVRLQRLAL